MRQKEDEKLNSVIFKKNDSNICVFKDLRVNKVDPEKSANFHRLICIYDNCKFPTYSFIYFNCRVICENPK